MLLLASKKKCSLSPQSKISFCYQKGRKKSADVESTSSSPGTLSAKAGRSASFRDDDGKRSSAGHEHSGPAVSFYVGSDPSISGASSADVEAQISRKSHLGRQLADHQRFVII